MYYRYRIMPNYSLDETCSPGEKNCQTYDANCSFPELYHVQADSFLKNQFIINPLVRNIEIPVESAAPVIPILPANNTVVIMFSSALSR